MTTNTDITIMKMQHDMKLNYAFIGQEMSTRQFELLMDFYTHIAKLPKAELDKLAVEMSKNVTKK